MLLIWVGCAMEGRMGSGFMLIYVIFVVIVGICWICLPFAIFGTKRRLDEQIVLLREILAELQSQHPGPPRLT